MASFAWIESGAHFLGCQLPDVVFRTARADNVIAIGNYDATSQARAAIYVKENSVGIRQMPVPGQALSVRGNIAASDTVSGALVQTRELWLGSNSQVFANEAGLLETRVAIANKYYVRAATISGVYIYSADLVEVLDEDTSLNISAIEVAIHQDFLDQLSDAPALVKGRLPFRIFDIKINETGRCVLTLVPQTSSTLNEAFYAGETTALQTLFESSSAQGIGNQLIFNFEKVLSDQCTLDRNPLHKVEEGILSITAQRAGLPLLSIGDCVYVSARRIRNVDAAFPTTILRTVSIETDDTDVAIIRFRNVDARRNLANLRQLIPEAFAGSAILYMYPLKSIPPPTFVNANVMVGYAVDARSSSIKYVVKDSSALAELVVIGQDSYAIDTMTLGARSEQLVNKIYASGPAQYTLDAFVDDAFFRSTRETLSATLRGVPMMIVDSAQTAAPNTINVLVSAEFALARQVMLKTHGYLFMILDDQVSGTWKIDSFSLEERRLTLSTMSTSTGASSFVLSNTMVYVIPVAFTRYVQVGEEQIVTYIPTALGIGTTDAVDTLTVNGTATIKERLTMQARSSTGAPFLIAHDDENRTLTLGSNVVVHEAGTVTAQDFIKFSDQRLKSDIERLDVSAEIEAINKINASKFRYKDTGRPVRGVIAQELQLVMPDAVYTECKMLPVPSAYVPVANVNIAANTLNIDRAAVDKLNADWTAKDMSRIRFVCAGATYHATVIRVTPLEMCIKVSSSSAALPLLLVASDLICITGIEVHVLCVDYDSILTSCICSIQYLYKNLRTKNTEA